MLSHIHLTLPHLFPTFIIDYYEPVDSQCYVIRGDKIELDTIRVAIFNTYNPSLIARYLNSINCSNIAFSLDHKLLLPIAKLVTDRILYYMLQYVYKFLPSNKHTHPFVKYAITRVELMHPTDKFYAIFKIIPDVIDIPTMYANDSFEDIDYVLSTGYKVDISELWKLDYRNEYIIHLILQSVDFVSKPHEHQLVYCMLYEFAYEELPRWAPNLIRQARCTLGVYLGIKHNLPYYTHYEDGNIVEFLDKGYDISVLEKLIDEVNWIPSCHCLKAMIILKGRRSVPLLLDDCDICQLIRGKYMKV